MTEYLGEYLYPPRPDKAIPSALLGFYENRNWMAQIKKNGTCNVLTVTADEKGRHVAAMTRHKTGHELWTPNDVSEAAFKALPGDGTWVFVAELLHSKVKGGPQNTNYLHDCLVADGKYLLGSAYADRYIKLVHAFTPQLKSGEDDAYKINDNTFILKNFYPGDDLSFKDRFKALSKPEDEGLVLKDPGARLRLCDREKANVDGMVKCRKYREGINSF